MGHQPRDQPPRAARASVCTFFLIGGAIVGSWVARIPAVKESLELSEGSLGAVFGGMAGAAAGGLVAGAGVPPGPHFTGAAALSALAALLASIGLLAEPGERQ